MLNKVLCRATPEEKKELKRQIDLSQLLLNKLVELVQDDIEDNDKVADEDFDNPSWALKQAYKIGYKKGLTRLLEYGILDCVKKK
jgi:hypothetical protein|nr:MAG TPA: hypothetical protein [Caudoviricetes sp.]